MSVFRSQLRPSYLRKVDLVCPVIEAESFGHDWTATGDPGP